MRLRFVTHLLGFFEEVIHSSGARQDNGLLFSLYPQTEPNPMQFTW